MMSTAMMKTTMLVVTMMEVLAALAMIHLDCGMLTALFVNVFKVFVKLNLCLQPKEARAPSLFLWWKKPAHIIFFYKK